MKRVVFSRFKKVILSLISVFLILISCSFILSAPINKNVSNFNDKDIPLSLKAADYPFGISPIIIDDNWTETEVLYEWCSGSGAWGDPFVIDNITLDCKEKSSGLVINNSDQYYFIIQNCTFYNCSSFPAIIIQNSKNGIVHECNFSRNNQIGIQLVKTDNCSFTFNTISYNEIGIYLEKTSECGFYKNNITHNSVEGVSISTTNSDLNLFYLNNFSSNGLNAYDAADNTWDNGSIGNYWDDYVGHDLDDDGIGDDPYIIDSDSQDNFPIWNDGDDINPTLTVLSPSNNTLWSTPPLINVSAFDLNLDTIWYLVNDSEQATILQNESAECLLDSLWNSLGQGKFNLTFYANDTVGNINNPLTIDLYKDTNNPFISINSPANHTFWNHRPPIEVSVSDSHFQAVWYEVNGQKEMLANGVSEILNDSIWDSILDESSFTVYFYANDSAGNMNATKTLDLYKDVINPTLSVDLPSDGLYCNTRPNIQATASDINLDSLWYDIGGTKILLDNGISELLDQGIWDSLSAEETFTIYFFANDSAGNINSPYSRIIHKDISNPIIIVNSPLNDTYWNIRPNIQVSVSDTNFDSVWYEVDGLKIMLENGVSELLDQSIWGSLSP
jgi:parallel beta-helix repeat protein